MAENYEEKKTYYIPAYVEQIQELGNYPVKVNFRIGEERCAVQFENLPDLLLTAEEVAKENDLYTSLRGEVVVVTENRKLKEKVASLQEENERLKADCNEWKDTANERLNAIQTLSAERNKVMAEVKDLTGQRNKYKEDAEYFHGEKLTAEENARSVRQENATLTGRNKRLESENASLKAERDQRNKDFWAMKKDRDELDSIGGKLRAENEKLKAENDNLRTQVGGYMVDIQDLASDVNYYKKDRDKWLNTAQDNAKLVDALQEENKSLKQELEGTKAACDDAVDTSLERKNRVVTMEEVIVALVEKIRRLEGDE